MVLFGIIFELTFFRSFNELLISPLLAKSFKNPSSILVTFIGVFRMFFVIGLSMVFPFFIIFDFILLLSLKKKNQSIGGSKNDIVSTISDEPTLVSEFQCPKCQTIIKTDSKFCPTCGTQIALEDIINANKENQIDLKNQMVSPTKFDSIYFKTETEMLTLYINRYLVHNNIDFGDNTKIPSELLKRKYVLNIIFVILFFIYITMIFFHFPIYTYLIGLIILLIFYKQSRKYDIMQYIIKQVKSRPQEKISNIIMSIYNSLVVNNSTRQLSNIIVLAVVIPIILFFKPHILYEKVDTGYAVRFYTFGIANFKSVSIPSEYKGKPVVSLRGNTFSNMFLLNKVTLPDTVTEIRGQAFRNDFMLSEVNIPSNLEYLGGGAFYNCSSIKSISLPDTLTYLGGESFYRASSLESIKLSNTLTEIRGNTFEECHSLKSVTIPDNVTRIGGHAFYNTGLETVNISENSKLQEIGSSAFRNCSSLQNIKIPQYTYVNERAFKESPTYIERYGEY